LLLFIKMKVLSLSPSQSPTSVSYLLLFLLFSVNYIII
jgi:hypothetical protein